MSALVHAVLAVAIAADPAAPDRVAPVAGAPSPAPAAATVPPPRPVAAPSGRARAPRPRPPEARPIAVATLGVSLLALACGLSLVAIGVESHRLAPDADTEGATVARDSGAVRLLAPAIPVASVGLVGVVGSIVWIARDRRRATRPRDQTARSRASAGS